MKIMASGLITSWEIDGETVETVSDFIFLGSKITADGDCTKHSHTLTSGVEVCSTGILREHDSASHGWRAALESSVPLSGQSLLEETAALPCRGPRERWAAQRGGSLIPHRLCVRIKRWGHVPCHPCFDGSSCRLRREPCLLDSYQGREET